MNLRNYWLLLVGALLAQAFSGQSKGRDFIPVLDRKVLGVTSLPAERTPIPLDPRFKNTEGYYKPTIVLLPDGRLVLTCFVSYEFPEGLTAEFIILFRSGDGGKTWNYKSPQNLGLQRRVPKNEYTARFPGENRFSQALLGREPYLSVTSKGVVFLTACLLSEDIRNLDGYDHSYLHRSADGGKTWTSRRIGPDGFPAKGATLASRNVLELPDGTLLLGVDALGDYRSYLWRSKDGGQTWQSQRVDLTGFKTHYGFFGGDESYLWRQKSGWIYCVDRVDANEIPISGRPIKYKWDNDDHMLLFVSTDQGASFRKCGELGDYGEMYPSLLRLRDDRILFTYTQRSHDPRLGLRAMLVDDVPEGLRFDFAHDRLLLETKTSPGQTSGGGFGNTVELTDGTLVSPYSYRLTPNRTELEVVRWKLPAHN